ncbi:hypothetical protein FEM48_Zijuj01G0268800 [Ziziphus jujuba var. spinosa]|uniref:Uncharacterized protein n=1 Tax=Ziziphus jujuba var. spinosa TaxID=714518 RepID=A0A978W542_ZIZJJ|nr:hypothetical protein FEM48_Zijuj01G0268800 [Ziziphus jujuba var. spinosa]
MNLSGPNSWWNGKHSGGDGMGNLGASKEASNIQKGHKDARLVIGRERWVEEKDIVKLPYIDVTAKETMTLPPVAPLLVPRLCREDIQIGGYDIPKNTRVFVNEDVPRLQSWNKGDSFKFGQSLAWIYREIANQYEERGFEYGGNFWPSGSKENSPRYTCSLILGSPSISKAKTLGFYHLGRAGRCARVGNSFKFGESLPWIYVDIANQDEDRGFHEHEETYGRSVPKKITPVTLVEPRLPVHLNSP